MARKCEPLRFEWTVRRYSLEEPYSWRRSAPTGRPRLLRAYKARSGEEVGEAEVLETPVKRLVMLNIEAYDPGCGYGTAMYEEIYRRACDRGLRLTSDTTRFEPAEGFWAKQHSKGRARCIPWRGKDRDVMRWHCRYYEMKKICPKKIDLSGVRKRKRRKKRKR